MRPSVLATAVELSRLHGVRYAAAYLQESGINIEVALDLLTHSPATSIYMDSPMSRPCSANALLPLKGDAK